MYVDYNNRNVTMKKILLFLSVFAVLSACSDEPVAVRVESIVFNLDVLQLTVGDSQSIDAVVLPDKAENKTLYWSSSNNSVATVTDGVASALSSGESVITAISEDGGKKASCTVIVTPELIPVTGITIDRENLRIFIGNKHTLVAIVAPADASNKQVIWSSSDESIATVDEGVVTGVGLGNARITAETKEKGFKVECNVKVTEECQTQTKGPMTLDLGHVTATTAVIAGYLDVDHLADYDMTGGGVGFMYAPASEDFNISTAKKVQISNVDSENSFSHTLTGLSYDSQYQYTIFLYKNGILQLGETQTFKTNDVQILVENVAVTNTTATMSGSVVRSEADTEVKVGIMCSSTNSFSSNTKISKEVIPSDDGAYTLSFDKLDVDKEYYYRTYVYHKGIYEYGDVFTFTTNGISVDLDVKSKTQTTAMFTGKLLPSTAIDEATIGILVNTSRSVSNNSYSKRFILSSEIVNSDGTFSFAISELKSNTTYYYTYYTLNNGKYTYGDISEFKTDEVQVSLLVANTTQTTATFTGNVFLTEKDEVEVGLVYSSTSSSPTVNNSSRILLSDIIDPDGAFSCKLNKLQNETTYYYRYYVKQNGNYVYGDVQNFSTESVTVDLSATDITQTTAVFRGSVKLTERDLIEIGLLYSSSSSSLTEENANKIVLTGQIDANGSFTRGIDGLLNDCTYYFCYYIKQNNIYAYGDMMNFKTNAIPITISVNTTQTSATFTGDIDLSEDDVVEVGLLYSSSSSTPMINSANKIVLTDIIDSNGNFTYKVNELQNATAYYYRYYVKQNENYVYGDVQNFSTESVTVDLSATDITQTTAVFRGSVKLTERDVVEVGLLYSLGSNPPTVENAEKVVFTDVIDLNGNFNYKLAGLFSDSIYYYRYYVEQNGSYTYGDVLSLNTEHVPVTLSIVSVTQTEAIIAGSVSFTEENMIEVGIVYSSSSSIPTISNSNAIILTDKINSKGEVSCKIERLLNGSTHYYRYYLKQKDRYIYGDVATFETKKVSPIIFDLERIEENIVTFKGNVQFTEEGIIEIGIRYYPKSMTSETTGVIYKKVTDVTKNGDFELEVSELSYGTEYYWQYYLLQNEVMALGPTNTFKIWDELSKSSSANCYVISSPGCYKFKIVKGNSNETVGSAFSSEVLWETFGTSVTPIVGDLIKNVSYDNGYLFFQTADVFKEGNAVIAVKDNHGNILWSWHIWMTTHRPQTQIYRNGGGEMMDRNLGALSSTPGDVRTLGLLYQWGRKDPFLSSSSISSDSKVKSTIKWPTASISSSTRGTIEYATAHPTTFIANLYENNGDWYYTGSSSTDNTRWTTSDSNKSIYDPCPAGWRVPDGGSNGVWAKACGGTSPFYETYDSTNEGMNFSGKFGEDSIIWYPAAGNIVYCSSSSDAVDNVGDSGTYWSATPSGCNACVLLFYDDTRVWQSTNSLRAYGFSVRCVKE